MQRRGARRILVVVALAVVVLLGLAWWVLGTEYTVDDARGTPVACGAIRYDDPLWDQAAFDRSCEDAHRDRRTTALLIWAAVATAAAAASTVPSRRLTGEALGPEPPGPEPQA